ncbi:hypothetical protein [Seleniivibrio sp.]|uniref:hypothetical protein n=1 Tax=Seleniivibrio sp. TaxID=2898801 RepID=UPI0025ED7955|nr:hypothetical protein [Seleniivibrio sp.]MCD8553705.1 hypothetical protein [Seleniivibrio sp.]
MAVYNVTYDLNATGQNYDGLIAEIKRSASWCKYQKSAFLIYTGETAQQVCDRLKPFIDKNDYLLVINCCGSRQGWLSQEAWDWINKYVPSC